MGSQVTIFFLYVFAAMYGGTRAASYFVSALHSLEQYEFEELPGGQIAAWIICMIFTYAIVDATTRSYGAINKATYSKLPCCANTPDNAPVANASPTVIANPATSCISDTWQTGWTWSSSIYCTLVMTSSTYRFFVKALTSVGSSSFMAYSVCAPLWLLLTPTLLAQFSTQSTNQDENSPGVKFIRQGVALTRLGEIGNARLASISNVIMFFDTCRKLLISSTLMKAPIELGWGIVLGLTSLALFISNTKTYTECLKKMTGNKNDLYIENVILNTLILGTWIILPLASALKAGTGLLGMPEITLKFITDFNLIKNLTVLTDINLWVRICGFAIPAVPSFLTMMAYFKVSADKADAAEKPTWKRWRNEFNLFSNITDNRVARFICCKSNRDGERMSLLTAGEETLPVYNR